MAPTDVGIKKCLQIHGTLRSGPKGFTAEGKRPDKASRARDMWWSTAPSAGPVTPLRAEGQRGSQEFYSTSPSMTRDPR